MPAYAKGRLAWGLCQRCGLRFLLRELVLDGYFPNIRVCTGCYDPPQPQERLAVVSDPVALWKPAVDTYLVPPPFLTAQVVGGQVVLNWTSIMAPAVGNDVGGRHHGPYLSAGYQLWRAPGQSSPGLYASLLLHMDGSFIDSSVNGIAVTAGGTVTSAATGGKFGGCGVFADNGGIAVPITPGGLCDLGVGDQTLEFWIKPHVPGTLLFSSTGFNGDTLYSGGLLAGSFFGTSTNTLPGSVPPDVWTFIAYVIKAGSLYIFANGVLQAAPQPINRSSMSGFLTFGGRTPPNPSIDFGGSLDDLRITASALYTSNFTPPIGPLTPTVVAPQVANQFSLLANFSNTADEFGALSIETLTYTDLSPPTPTAIYYVRGYDTHENAQNG